MWNSFKYCVHSTSFSRYSNINDHFVNKISSFLKKKPVNLSFIVRCQTNGAKSSEAKHLSFTLAKQPPPSYIKSIPPNKSPQSRSISPGEWLLLTIPIATFGLGTWQVQRRKWKIGLIEDLEKLTSEPVIDFPDDLSELNELEYRKVRVRGKFDHSNELYLGPRSLVVKGEAVTQSGLISGAASKTVGGHYVITPFILSDSGKRILVNRGWVPSTAVKPEKRPEGQIEDEVEITGVVRLQENRGTFIPENKPHLKVFHYRDVKKMARKCNALPVFLDATEETTVPGGPIGGQTIVSIRNEHASYIFTWYALSAITGILWCKKYLFRSMP